MPLRSFQLSYRFDGVEKTAALPEWLADNLDVRFQGDLGLIQTTRLPVHQTKVRLLAAAIDAVEAEVGREIALDEVDTPLVERGLLLCVEHHRQAWRDLGLDEPPSFAHAFELYTEDPREPAFMQCPAPERASVVAEEFGIKLLPDFGFAAPSLVPAEGMRQLAFQLIAFAGKQFYVKGQPTSSRPLAQAVAIDVPDRPAWRCRHEVATTLAMIPFAQDELGLKGSAVFAWLLPYLPAGRPIPRRMQHACLLDVGSPLRVRADGRVAVYSRTCRIGNSDMQLGSAALGPRDAWAASALPCLPLSKGAGARRRGSSSPAGKVEGLAASGLEAQPALVQRPFGKVPRSRELVELLQAARLGPEDEQLGVPVLDIYRAESTSGAAFELPTGAELVVEGEPIGASTTENWLEVRVPLPDPAAGAERPRDRWAHWRDTCQRQLEARAKTSERLRAVVRGAFIRRQESGGRQAGRRTVEKANAFARRWGEALEGNVEGAFWRIAARTWHDRDANQRKWSAVLDGALRATAQEAFMALGGFDDPATMMAAARSGLLDFVERRAVAA